MRNSNTEATRRKMDEGMVIWITGLSCSGKTTLAEALAARLERAVILDGDELRRALESVCGGYDVESRRRIAFAYARLAAMLASRGHVVIVAAIALFHEVHQWNREHCGQYCEVLLDVPMEELRERDAKGLYGPTGRPPNVAGVDLRAEFPTEPHLRLSPGHDSVKKCVVAILTCLKLMPEHIGHNDNSPLRSESLK